MGQKLFINGNKGGINRKSGCTIRLIELQLSSFHVCIMHDFSCVNVSIRLFMHCWRPLQSAQWRLNSRAPRLFAQPFVQAQINENSKAPRHGPLWPVTGIISGKSTRTMKKSPDMMVVFIEAVSYM